jgi:hypothetical protein
MASSTMSDPRQDPPKIKSDLTDVAHRVHQEFDELLDPATVDECIDRVAAKFVDAKVRSFVPLLVRRYVRAELHGQVERA